MFKDHNCTEEEKARAVTQREILTADTVEKKADLVCRLFDIPENKCQKCGAIPMKNTIKEKLAYINVQNISADMISNEENNIPVLPLYTGWRVSLCESCEKLLLKEFFGYENDEVKKETKTNPCNISFYLAMAKPEFCKP